MVTSINWIALCIFTLGIISLLSVKTFVDNKTLKEYSDEILNIFPVFILFFIPTDINVLIWVIGITLAYNIIEKDHQNVGIFIYLLVYSFVGIVLMIKDFHWMKLLISMMITSSIIIILSILINKLCKETVLSNNNSFGKKLWIMAIMYAVFSFTSLIYTFSVTYNFGFIALVLSDILLGIKYILYYGNKMNPKTNKIMIYFILLLFYIGVIFASASIPYL